MLPGKETLVMTEDEQLANLRENPNWQPKLDPLAKEAAEKGRLVDAVVKANTRMGGSSRGDRGVSEDAIISRDDI